MRYHRQLMQAILHEKTHPAKAVNVTVISLEFAFLIGGLVVTEQVFNLNGLGKLLVDAVTHRDYPLIQALVLLLAAIFVIVNFIVDMLYVVLDPRVRYS